MSFLLGTKPMFVTVAVILDSSGYTKGYGFVRFGSGDEQRNALYSMNGYTGLGSKPLKICTAVPKPKGAPNTQSSSAPSSGPNYSSGTVCLGLRKFDLLLSLIAGLI